MLLEKFLIRIMAFIILSVLLSATPAKSDIYKYVDEEGVIHLTNVPTEVNVNYILVMKEKPVHFNLPGDITKYDDLITKASSKYNVSCALVKAVIKAESNFNHRAVSPKGAQGLMQLMPATASYLQVPDTFQPEHNIEGGVRYLRYLLNLFHDDLPLALAAYNAGEKAVARYNGVPPFIETRNYVQRVLSLLDRYGK